MSPQTEKALGSFLAILGGIIAALLVYFLLFRLLNFPQRLALSLAVIIGGVKYFVLRFWLGRGRQVKQNEP